MLSEERVQQIQQEQENEMDSSILQAVKNFPYFVLNNEQGLNASLYFAEIAKITKFYNIYNKGAKFVTEGTGSSYIASTLKFRNINILINKEARYMFSKTPEIKLVSKNNEEQKEVTDKYQKILDKVLQKSHFEKKLLQSAKDCFIGKRICCVVDFSERKGAMVRFYKSLEFYYETEYDSEELTKLITFKNVTKSFTKAQERYLVNRYEVLGDNVYLRSILTDGAGNVVDELIPETRTELQEIPAIVITNDGTLDSEISEVEELKDYEAKYSFISNCGIDSTRKAMNPIRYTVDMNPNSTENLNSGAGAYWDLEHDENIEDPHPQVGTLAPSMTHTEPVRQDLERIKTTMYNQVDVPNITEETMVGTITSGKALEILYYPLTVRCNEKMKTWLPALEFVVRQIITFVNLNADLCEEIYKVDALDEQVEFDVDIQISYALPKDEESEKAQDLEEIATNTRSRKSYMKKWRPDEFKQDEQIDEELLQIAKELNMFDTMSMNASVQGSLQEQQNSEEIEDEIELEEAQEEL